MELQHRRDYKSRWELAETMVELSRWHTVRAQKDIVAAEIDQALHDIFGRPAFPRKVQPFGVGANHMYGRQLTNRPLPPELAIPDELRLEIQQLKHDVLQMAALVGAPPEFEAPGYEPSADRPVAVEFAAEQERLRSIRRPRGFHRGELGLRAASVDAYDEYQEPISKALELAGLHWGHVYQLEREGMEALLEAIPIVLVNRELRRLRHEASQQPWDQGDLADIASLSTAIVYCDVVVTERLWTDIVGRTRLQQRFGTVVLRDLKELVPHLIGAAQAA